MLGDLYGVEIQAREKRDEACKLLADGIDPGENRKVQKAAKIERAANIVQCALRLSLWVL